jgi:hypothetical protein
VLYALRDLLGLGEPVEREFVRKLFSKNPQETGALMPEFSADHACNSSHKLFAHPLASFKKLNVSCSIRNRL